MEDGVWRRAEVYLRHQDGHRVPVAVRACPVPGKDREIIGGVEIFNNNSRRRAMRERARDLAKVAFLDPVTHVANRRYLDQRLSQQLDPKAKCGTPFGIMRADLDEFKNINGPHCHVAGDAALFTGAGLCPAVCVRRTCWDGGEATNSW